MAEHTKNHADGSPRGGPTENPPRQGTQTAARLNDPLVLVDNALYWSNVGTDEEGRYLIAIFNSDTLKRAVAPLLSKGQFGARNLNRFLFHLPIPRFDESADLHDRIAKLGLQAEETAAAIDVEGLSNVAARTKIRAQLSASGLMHGINTEVEDLFARGL